MACFAIHAATNSGMGQLDDLIDTIGCSSGKMKRKQKGYRNSQRIDNSVR